MKQNHQNQGRGRKSGSQKRDVSDYRLLIVLGGTVVLSFVIIAALIYTSP